MDMSLILTVVAVVVAIFLLKKFAALVGVVVIGYLAYYGYNTYPTWVDSASVMIEQWVA